MLNPRLKERISQGYAKLGDIGFDIALNLKKGKDYTHKQQELWVQGILLRLYLQKLFQHVDFTGTNSNIPVLYNATEAQVNIWVDCIVKIGLLDKYPIAPSLLPTTKPYAVNKGVKGDTGDTGATGDDANIVVEAAAGELAIIVTMEEVAGVKHYKIAYNPYSNPELLVGIQGTKVFEVGTVNSFNLAITTTKGKDAIVSLIVITPPELDPDLQAIINLVTLNGVFQPVLTTLPIANVSQTTIYQIEVSDGTNQISKTDTASFVYPFLYGNNELTVFDRYTLSKLVAVKATRTLLFNGVEDYFYICYPVEYGLLESIKDQNGFDVTTDWQVVEELVTSNSLPSDWTKNYKVYRTVNKTTINNRLFTITFPS